MIITWILGVFGDLVSLVVSRLSGVLSGATLEVPQAFYSIFETVVGAAFAVSWVPIGLGLISHWIGSASSAGGK